MPKVGIGPITELELTLNSGQKVTVQLMSIAPAEPDVGIMTEGPDCYYVLNDEGQHIEDDLSEEDDQYIVDKLCDYIQESRYPDEIDPEDYDDDRDSDDDILRRAEW